MRRAGVAGMIRDPLRRAALIFMVGAISNFIVTVPAFVVYPLYIRLFVPVAPNYPFLVWIWSGMAFLWGVMFFEISRNVAGTTRMMKYAWLEKAVTSTSTTVAFATHNIPLGAFLGVVYTDIIWIPLFIWAQIGVAGAIGPERSN